MLLFFNFNIKQTAKHRKIFWYIAIFLVVFSSVPRITLCQPHICKTATNNYPFCKALHYFLWLK